MIFKKTSTGFELVEESIYPPPAREIETPTSRLVQQSSAIGDYEDAFDKPGSSFLWIGKQHHLDREQVEELRDRLTAWLETGTLEI